MRKNMLRALYAVLMGLFIYSCSGLTLPEKVGVKGTVNLPIRVGAANLNEIIKEEIKKAFPPDANGKEQLIEVHNVNYTGQTVQTFFIYLPFEMTEDLNPNTFLKKIDEQIEDSQGEPKVITIPCVPGGPAGSISIPGIGLDGDNSLSFVDIAQYVKTISFDTCNEEKNKEDDLKGIGFNLVFEEEVPDGLEMTIDCRELFIHTTRLLKQGDNIFGNNIYFPLELDNYKTEGSKLDFTITLTTKPTDPSDPLHLWNPVGYESGDPINITGKMHFFRKWEEIQIDLSTAINKFSKKDDTTGKFPKDAFDLRRLGTYFDGGFEFSDKLEVKVYMECSVPDLLSKLETNLVLRAEYTDGPEENKLYDDPIYVNSQPINIDNYINKKDDTYIYQHLPEGDATEHGAKGVDPGIVKGIFQKMPDDLHFLFNIEVTDRLIITPDDVKNADKASVIKTTMMILLPISLTAEGKGDGTTRSAITLPDMFGKDKDLFGREELKNLFSKGEINHIKMTIDFANPIFTGGHLFIKKDEEGKDVLFPDTDGIPLSGSKTEVNFTKKQFDIIDKQLIYPNIRIEIKDDEMIIIPKDMAIMSIKIDVEGIINVGEH